MNPEISEFQMIKIGSIVIHCYEFKRMVAFWQEALALCTACARKQ